MARVRLEEDGVVRLPERILAQLGVSPGRAFEAEVEKGRLVLAVLPRDDDPFAQLVKRPDDSAFEKAMDRDVEEKRKAQEAFERGLKETKDVDVEKLREDHDRWR